MDQKKRSFSLFRRIFFSILIALIAAILFFFISSLFLRVETFSLPTNVSSPIRIVHLSDLHNARFGKLNQKLVDLVRAQDPDLIIMSGDMLNEDDESTDIVTSLIHDLSCFAPVYYGYGNHERSWEARTGNDLRPILHAAGAVVVDNCFVDVTVNGTDLRIGGYMGYYPIPHMTTHEEDQQALEFAFIASFQDTDRTKLLIDHIPTGWIDWNYVDKYPVDIVFSGHYHGGVIRIPVIDQGLYAPYVGWFPPFTKGIYSGKTATCVLSPGLGNEHGIPRFNDPPEIFVVDLIPDKEYTP